MNTNCLAKLYDRLTPHERLPLIVAASARDDETERQGLAHSAPCDRFRLPDYHGLAEGLLLLSLFHVTQLLDLAVMYWRTTALLEDIPLILHLTRRLAREGR
jgi:hypothetical protein